MSSTLLSWLRQMGDRKAVAAELHVHPQTVSYCVGRLRELFGPALDQADVRINRLLALGWGPATAHENTTAVTDRQSAAALLAWSDGVLPRERP